MRSPEINDIYIDGAKGKQERKPANIVLQTIIWTNAAFFLVSQ